MNDRGRGDHLVGMNPLLISRDRALTEIVESVSAAAQIDLDLARDVEVIRAAWRAARVVLVGGDMAATVLGMALPPRSAVYCCAVEAQDAVAWSVPLGAAVLVLPQHSGFLATVISGQDTLPATSMTVRVVGGSGGLGASTLAAALALRAATHSIRAALVELDWCAGGADVLVGIERQSGWRWPDLAAATGHLGDLTQHLPSLCGVNVLATGRDPTEPSASAVAAVLASLGRSHELVILDSGTATEPLHPVDADVVVVGGEVRQVLAARARLATWGLTHPHVVLRSHPGSLAPALVADALDQPVAAVLPTDRRLAADLRSGVPPHRSRRMARVCEQVLSRIGVIDAHP